MVKWKVLLVLAATAAIVAAAVGLGDSSSAQVARRGKGYAPVKVLNGPTEPVPIQGVTTIAGTADVKVSNVPLPVNVTNTPLPTAPQGVTSVAGTVQAVQSGSWSMSVAGTADVNVANTPTVTVGNDPGNPVFVSSVGSTVSGLPALSKTLGGPGTFSASASTAFHDVYTSWTALTLCLTVDNFGSGDVQFFFEVGPASRAHLVPAGKMEVGCSDAVDRITFQCASGCKFDWRIDGP